MAELLEVRGVRKSFKNRVVLDGVSFSLGEGEIGLLLGANGSGKTTTLKIVAGLINPEEGEILIGGRVVLRKTGERNQEIIVPPWDRNIAYIPSDSILFDHLSVYDNIALGLKKKGLRGRELDERVREAIEILELENYMRARPRELSQGLRQRTAIARALALGSRLLLMDEPFSNIDPETRLRVRIEIKTLLRKLKITTLIASNYVEDALVFKEKILVLEKGVISYQGPFSEESCRSSIFLSKALGYNVLPVRGFRRIDDNMIAVTDLGDLVVRGVVDPDSSCFIIIPPKAVEIWRDKKNAANVIRCEDVEEGVTPLGRVLYCYTGGMVLALSSDYDMIRSLNEIMIFIPPERIEIKCSNPESNRDLQK
ncbi:MAG: ATP-binding cassette domain-containing protein [Sulfolobales archaeon]